jgi:epoxyqueuosine reductase
MLSAEQLSAATKQAAQVAGFDLAGIAPVREEDFPEIEAFEEWIASGKAGEMAYMEKRTEAGELKRSSAKHSAPWVKSVVVCAINYNTAHPYSVDLHDPAKGWISRYAWGAMDYHDALMPRLREVESAIKRLASEQGIEIETRCYVDTGPLLERVYAKYAGIGWIGKNTCLINQKIGSWMFLGVILTSLELRSDEPAPDRCGSCTRCIDACPTAAIVSPGKLDARRCIAYLTIEKRGRIAEEFRSGIGHHVFGCDICQDVCPWNRKAAPATPLPEFQSRPNLFHPDLQALAEMNEEQYRQAFRGSPIKRAKFAGLKRNVAIAMGNSGNPEFLPVLEEMSASPDETVAEHARWAMEKLRSS